MHGARESASSSAARWHEYSYSEVEGWRCDCQRIKPEVNQDAESAECALSHWNTHFVVQTRFGGESCEASRP